MKNFTKLMLTLALLVVGVGGAKAADADAISTRVYATNYTSWGTTVPGGWQQENCTVTVGEGILQIVNETDQGQYNDWKAQAHVATGITTVVGNDYVVRIKFKGSVDGSVNCLFGNWGKTVSKTIAVTTDWQTLDLIYDNVLDANSFVMFHLGHYVGTIQVETAEVYDYVQIQKNDYSTNYTSWGTTVPGGWQQENCTVTVGEGILQIVNETDQGQYNDWKAQAHIATGISTKVGGDYIVRIKFKGSVDGSVNCLFGNWGKTVSKTIAVTTDWQTLDIKYFGALDANSFVMFHLGHYVGTILVEKTEVISLIPARFVTVGAAGYSTFSTDKAVNVDGVVTAYKAKYVSGSVVLTPVTEVPANTGVIIEAAADNYKVPVLESATALTENDLLVSDGTVEGDGSTIFVLANGSSGVGFYKLQDGDKVPSGKAYMVIPASSNDFIGFDDTTDLNEVRSKITEVRGNVFFDLQGRRVANPTKGLYIVNGKKVIIK